MSLMLNSNTKPHGATKAVVYARVSSVKQTIKGDGLNSQITRCGEYAKYKGYEIVDVFKDDISGGKATRPAMQEMLSFLRTKRRNPHVVIIDDISRLARGIEAHIQLRSAIASASGILESPSIEFGDDSDSQLVENLLAVVSQHQRQKNGEQTKNRMLARAMNGYWVFPAPLGYRYEQTAGQGKLLVRHEPMASILEEALKGFASGRFETQAEVLHYLDKLPHFPRDRKGIIRHQRIKDFLTNPLYAGMVHVPNWDLPMRKGKHEGLISFQAFKKIQDRIEGRAKVQAPVRKNISKDFTLRGFVTCGNCENILTSCWAKGRSKKYAYYHCRTKGCESYGKSIRRNQLEGEFEEILEALTPSKKLFAVARSMFKELWDHRISSHKDHAKALRKQIVETDKAIEGLLTRIVDADSTTVIKAYEKRISELEAGKFVLAEQISNLGKPKKAFEETFRTAMEFIANPSNLWVSGIQEHRQMVLKLAFAKRPTYTKGHGFRTAKPSKVFEVIQGLSEILENNVSSKKAMAHWGGFEPPTP
ncbi:MAG: recombinase [Robiginitomaculum sp.]|nr:MAG: recombinase [Robiginitomaculum sp.]